MDLRTAFLALLLVILGATAALMITPLLQYVMAASLLAFVLYPAHERLAPVVGPRPSALALTAVAIVAVVVPLLLVSFVVLGTTLSFLRTIDVNQVVATARDVAESDLGLGAERVQTIESAVITELEASTSDAVEIAINEIVGLVYTSFEMGIGLVVFVFLLYYLLVDGAALVDWVGQTAPLEAHVSDALFAEVYVVTWAVIKSHVFVAIIQGLLGGLGLLLLGVPNVAFWTVIMTIVAFLPAIGVWLVWGPAAGYLWLTSGPASAVALLLYGITVLSLVDNYLRAFFVDRGSGLHPAVVLIGVIGGIYVLGIMGLFLGPVVFAVLKAGLNVFSDISRVPEHRPVNQQAGPSPGTGTDGQLVGSEQS